MLHVFRLFLAFLAARTCNADRLSKVDGYIEKYCETKANAKANAPANASSSGAGT